MDEKATSPGDPKAIVRTAGYRRLLVLAAVVGFFVSLAAWAFLTLVPWTQDRVYVTIPHALGFSDAPWWWPLPVLAIAGLISAFAIVRLPGNGGPVPAEGFAGGVTSPADLPGILLAGLAALGLGLVLGPSMPVIALGSGLAVFAVRKAKSDAPDNVVMVMAAAGSFAALAMVFGSPVISAVILIEAAGLGGAMLPLILLPGLLAAGIGSLVYLGMGYLTGLDTSAYAINPLALPAMPQLTVVDFCWTVAVAALAAVVTFAIFWAARRLAVRVRPKPFLLLPLAGLIVAGLAITFAQLSDQTPYAVLFSGSRALIPVVEQAGTLSVATLGLLLACKGLAWSVSMGSFRGGPVFPAIFVGAVGGLIASHLPSFPEGAAIATVMAATIAAALRLPLSAVVIALLLTSSAGPAVTPLIIVATVVSYVLVDVLEAAFAPPAPKNRAASDAS
ncbi:chloride channel protein [Kribbella sp. NBC_01484]|uniref:chloride channel protein n=1 Tax=Kribbella sp. NBC_01484 TaxID=2903579 RepID=UPI002E348DEF|nr:chloride channel protein [Kribbella sp. NBC_01484]